MSGEAFFYLDQYSGMLILFRCQQLTKRPFWCVGGGQLAKLVTYFPGLSYQSKLINAYILFHPYRTPRDLV
ncbi:hypothetical protein GCM10010918_07640 [Paenibacillus radicis (ex Gao et al. 2016)]|uniref:Uncharacterized protein n=1 Tax=Paenibacillus radicis (ex Gao et al. 2016) TaxID=1737354 RepID=A0A917LTU4_9BACL|nr:hypothetical protein GCM10010918_07640 [Paenibacillus radicis (ex Gao et al. 2016)]